MAAPFIVYNNGATAVSIDCGQGFRVHLPPGTSVELARTGRNPQQARAPGGRHLRRRLVPGTPEYAAEKARLDEELDEYMAQGPAPPPRPAVATSAQGAGSAPADQDSQRTRL